MRVTRAGVGRLIRIAVGTVRALLRSPRTFVADLERYLLHAKNAAQLASPVGGLPNVVPITFGVRPASGVPRLNVLIPGMALWAMSGGPNTALNLTLRLAREGVRVRYISTDVAADTGSKLWRHLRELTGIESQLETVEFVSAHDRAAETEIDEDDIFFGTAWWTVQMIKHVLGDMRSRRFLYLIQDYEPALYPWSTSYALALETYGLDFTPIVNESFLLEYFRSQNIGRFAERCSADDCLVFEPAVDRRKFYPEDVAVTRRRRLLFYARPNAPRNLYELGLLALKEAAEQGAFPPGEWDLRVIGERVPTTVITSTSILESEEWASYDDYASLLRSSDVGLALMLSPHTGYPVLEMAASGMSAVTTTFATKTPERLTSISGNIIPTAPTVESIRDGLLRAYERTNDVEARVDGSRTALPTTWEESFGAILPRVLRLVEECRAVSGVGVAGVRSS
jgi:hypothetical protein